MTRLILKKKGQKSFISGDIFDEKSSGKLLSVRGVVFTMELLLF